MSYEGLFIRHAIGATPTTNTGAWTASPDIIPWGTGPAPDPSDFTTAQSYDNGYYDHSSFYIQQPNYVYLRAKNEAPGPLSGRLWLYYTSFSILLWPQNWLDAHITVNGQAQNYVDVSATENGEVVVTESPLVVVPSPPPNGDNHFCLISMAENDQNNPPVSPKPQEPFNSLNDLAHFVLTNPGMGMRNVTEVPSGAGTWTQTVPLQGPPDGGTFQVGVQCREMPTDGFIAFSVQGPPHDPAGTVVIPKRPITSPNMMFTAPVSWSEPNYQSSIVITYTQGATPPPAGASISAVVLISSPDLHESHGHLMDETDVARLAEDSQAATVLNPESGEVEGIAMGYMVGAFTFMFDGKG